MSSDVSRARAFIGLGSNLADPPAQIARAFRELAGLPHSRVVRYSSLYRSAPMGPEEQPPFINAVAELETALGPDALLDALQAIENAHGRVRAERWGPRTLDLDLLLYGEQEIATDRLAVPHPGLPVRNFVLYPLAEIAPALIIPGSGSVSELAGRIGDDGLERLDG